MGMMLLIDYARKHGKDPTSATRKANRGTFQTAVKIGRQWFIDEDEPYSDTRLKTGKYVDWRKKG